MKRKSHDRLIVPPALWVTCRYNPPPSGCMPGPAVLTFAGDNRLSCIAIAYQRIYPRDNVGMAANIVKRWQTNFFGSGSRNQWLTRRQQTTVNGFLAERGG